MQKWSDTATKIGPQFKIITKYAHYIEHGLVLHKNSVSGMFGPIPIPLKNRIKLGKKNEKKDSLWKFKAHKVNSSSFDSKIH